MKVKFTSNKSSEFINPFNEKQYTKLVYCLDISFNKDFFEDLKIFKLIENKIVNMPILAELIKYNSAINTIRSCLHIVLLEKEISNKYIIFPTEKTYEGRLNLFYSEKSDLRDIITWINNFEFTEDNSTIVEWQKSKGCWKEEDLKIIKEALSLVNMSELYE